MLQFLRNMEKIRIAIFETSLNYTKLKSKDLTKKKRRGKVEQLN